MNKKLKYFILVVVLLVLVALVYLIIFNNQNKNTKNNSAKVLNSTSEQQAAQQAKQKIVPPAPVYTKEVKVEFMTDAEKLTMSLPAALKIQVLERDKTGKITAYKIIRQDSDIMTKYGN